MEMNLKVENFIVATTTEFWAEIYRKRKRARFHHPDYDLAAEINQLPGIGNLHDQDSAVKDIFREMVSYITEVLVRTYTVLKYINICSGN